jgi:hypothetical protein
MLECTDEVPVDTVSHSAVSGNYRSLVPCCSQISVLSVKLITTIFPAAVLRRFIADKVRDLPTAFGHMSVCYARDG